MKVETLLKHIKENKLETTVYNKLHYLLYEKEGNTQRMAKYRAKLRLTKKKKGIYLRSSKSYKINMKIYVYKLKNKEILTTWAEELKQRETEAIQTLEEENVLAESIHTFEISGETYGVGFMVGKEGGIKPPNMEREINQKHRQVIIESIEEILNVKEVYSFRNK